MNATELHDLTAPLFAKHPSAKPELLSYLETGYWIEEETNEYHCCEIRTDSASLIIQGHLAQWLAEKSSIQTVVIQSPVGFLGWRARDVVVEYTDHSTLLHALVSACMEVAP